MASHGDRVVVEHYDLTDACAAAVLRLNRPEDLNPLDWDTVRDLEERLRGADADPRVRVVLVTGAGRAFSAGGDLKAYQRLQRDREAFPAFLADLHRTFTGIRAMRKPVVALVNGVTAAGGLELLASCDFGYAAESARIGDAHVRFGQMGGGGALTLLPRLLSPALARELVFSGRYLSAEEARAWGLVNRVVADEQLLEAGLAFGRAVAATSALAVANAKYVMNSGWADGTGVDAALRLERERTSFYCVTSDDAKAGLAAFAEKRTPTFEGR